MDAEDETENEKSTATDAAETSDEDSFEAEAAEAASRALASLGTTDDGAFAAAQAEAGLGGADEDVDEPANEADSGDDVDEGVGDDGSDDDGSEAVDDAADAQPDKATEAGSDGDADASAADTADAEDSADETVLIDRVAPDASLTRELPGKGSSPAMDKTVMFGETPLPVPPTVHEIERAERRSKKHPFRNALVIALIVVIAGGGAAGYRWWQNTHQDGVHVTGEAARTMVSVKLSVKAPGLDASKGTKIPIAVSGKDANGNLVDEVLYVDQSGKGIELLPGTYSFTAAASPIAADGTVYRLPKDKLTADVEKDGQDLSSAGTLEFDVPSADAVTDSQIEMAYKYAAKGGCSSADVAAILKNAATQRRDIAVAAVKTRNEKVRQEADARHKATTSYSFDIPVEWYGHVSTWQNGNTVCVYLTGHENLPIATITMQKDGYDQGNTDNYVVAAKSLGNGYSITVTSPIYPWIISQTANGKTKDPVDTYDMDTACELVELQTGNSYTYDQIKGELSRGKGAQSACTKLVQDYISQVLLPSIKTS